MKKLIWITGICTLFFLSCKKSNDGPTENPGGAFAFKTLSAKPDTLHPGETTSINADASGNNLSYQWSVSHGDLFGSGHTVTFGAAPCCVGNIYVTCVASDGNNSSSKQITLVVQN